MPINSSSIPALRIARELRRRKRAEGGQVAQHPLLPITKPPPEPPSPSLPVRGSYYEEPYRHNVEVSAGPAFVGGHVSPLSRGYGVKAGLRFGFADGGQVFDPMGAPVGIEDPERTESEAYPNKLARATIQSVAGMPKAMLWDQPRDIVEAAKRMPLPGDRSPEAGEAMEEAAGQGLMTAIGTMGGPLVGAPRGAMGSGPVRPGRRAMKAPEAPAIAETPRELVHERPIQEAGSEVLGGGPAPQAAGDVSGGLGGSAGRGASLEEAARAAARWAGERKPIEGLPVKPQYIEGHGYLQPGPIGKIHDVAEAYMRAHRPEVEYAPPTEFRPVDPEHSKSIAQAYEEMKHEPDSPAVKNAYEAMINETKAQYEAIKSTGLKIEPIPAGMPDPYAKNPRLAAHDVAENNHLWFFPTSSGHGTLSKISDNPLLRPMGEKIGDHEMLANDMFRVVHDYFGHLQHGHGFRAAGEDNAWRSHSAMYSDIARPAMTSETRGQNSWVNYGPHGEKNRNASGVDTIYADQKVGLMPDWTMYDRGKAPIDVYTGSPHDYNKPSLSAVGKGEGNQAYGHGLYTAGHEPVAERYRIALSVMQDPLLRKYGLREQSHVLGSHLADAGGDAAKLAFEYGRMRDHLIKNGPFDKASENLIKEYDRRIAYLNDEKRAKGFMYKQGLEADPAHLLDYDNPFHKQSGYVQERVGPGLEEGVKSQIEAIEKQLDKGGRGDPASRYFRRFRESERQALEGKLLMLQTMGHHPFEGKQIYKHVGFDESKKLTGQPPKDEREMAVNASKHLRELGIPAMRYLDAGSRTTYGRVPPKSTHNYVVFDDSKLRIHRKYAEGGGVSEQRVPAQARLWTALGPQTGVESALGAPKLEILTQQIMEASRRLRISPEQARDLVLSGKAGAFLRGGAVVDSAMNVARQIKRAKGGKVHVGPITGATGGRADKRPMKVPNGSYVLTADHVSGMGEGNTEAGMKKLSAMFPKSKPSRMREIAGDAVPIYAADGEFVVSPEDIVDRWGDVEQGHRNLDAWQTSERQKLIHTLKNLDPPAQD